MISDGCGMDPVIGLRYKCSVCPEYELCKGCYFKKIKKQEVKMKEANGGK